MQSCGTVVEWDVARKRWCLVLRLLAGGSTVRWLNERPLRVIAVVRKALVWVLVFGPIAASGQDSPADHPSATPTPVYTISGVVLDTSQALIVAARVTLYGKHGTG